MDARTFVLSDSLDRPPSRLRTAAILTLLATLWITTRHYLGVIHDARLYTAQALNTLYPGRFADDLFFRYGSQDSFTIYSKLYEPLVAALGVSHAHMLAAAVGQGLWLAALGWLVSSLFEDGTCRMAAALGAILLLPDYGGLSVFRYGEPFATPRIFAEAGVMGALAAALAGRWLMAGFIVVFAAAVHPIMAATGGAVLAFMAALKDRRAWIAIGVGAALVIGAALAGVAPFDRLLARFDDAWFAVIRQRCSFTLIGGWRASDWLQLAANGAIMLVAWTIGARKERQLICAVVFAATAGVILTYVGGDIGRDILVVNLQPWRILWLLSLSANLFAGAIVVRQRPGSTCRELFLALFLVDFVALITVSIPAAPAVLALLACAAFAGERRLGRPLPRGANLALVAVPAAVLLVSGLAIWSHRDQGVFAVVIASGCVGFVALTLLIASQTSPTRAWILALAPLVGIAALTVRDQRTNWQKAIESSTPPPGLGQFLAGSKNVYWEGTGFEPLWLSLKLPSYYSCAQGAGVLFYRGTAMEWARKSAALRTLNTQEFSSAFSAFCGHGGSGDGPSSAHQIVETCRALPDLDSIVLNHAAPAGPVQQWTAPAPLEIRTSKGKLERIQTFYKYSCSNFR